MTDVDTDFVRTLTLELAADVDERTDSGGLSKTEAFYEALEDRGIAGTFRDQQFSQSLVKVMKEEWDVERDEDEANFLVSQMREHDMDNNHQIGNAASAISRLRRLVLANTSDAS